MVKPICDRSLCFAYKGGECIALRNNEFNRECPFFKDRDKKAEEDKRCAERAAAWKREQEEKAKNRRISTNIADEGAGEQEIDSG